MKPLLIVLLLVVWLFKEVVGNLVANQVEAWLPGLARWIVRRNAQRMDARAESCEEEWSAHVDATAGGLSKVWVAVTLSWAPWRTLVELWRDGRIDSRVILSHTGAIPILSVVVATILLFVRFPPRPIHYAAYAFCVPVLLIAGLWLATPARRAFASLFERLNYVGRVAVGGTSVPLSAYLLMALAAIPTRGAESEVSHTRGVQPQLGLEIVYGALPLDPGRQEFGSTSINGARSGVVHRVPELSTASRPISRRVPKQRAANLSVPTDDAKLTPAGAKASVAALVGPAGRNLFEQLDWQHLAAPQQPMPGQSEYALRAPAAPMNVRIVAQ